MGEHEWWNQVTVFEQGQRATLFKLKNIQDYLEGKSFDKVLYNPSLPLKKAVYATIYQRNFKGRTVKTKQWRYTEWDEGIKGIELYDQVNDPIEYNNLSSDEEYNEIIEEMKDLFNM